MTGNYIGPDYGKSIERILTGATQDLDTFNQALMEVGFDPSLQFSSPDGERFFPVDGGEEGLAFVLKNQSVEIPDQSIFQRIKRKALLLSGDEALKYLESLEGYVLVSSGDSTFKYANNGVPNGKVCKTAKFHYDSDKGLPVQVGVDYVPENVIFQPGVDFYIEGKSQHPRVIKVGIYLTVMQDRADEITIGLKKGFLNHINDPEQLFEEITQLKEESNLSQLVSLLS